MTRDMLYPIWDAAEDGRDDVVRKALDNDPSLATAFNAFDYQPTTVMTLLHVAASRDNLSIMRMLLDAGADPNALAPPDKPRMTPLHCAGRGQGAAVELLLDAGADPNTCVKRGITPLYTAAYNGNLEGCRQLLTRGAHPDGKPSSGVPLFAAAMESQIDVIKLLLESGAKLTPSNRKKETALHHAAHRGNAAVNRFLLEQGLDPDKANKKGQTPRTLIATNTLGGDREALAALYEAWPPSA